jgi:peptide/nickel transport system permease protein
MTMLLTIFVISIVSFTIIQLPPGDYLTSHIAGLRSQGEEVDEGEILALTIQYGLDKTPVEQYFKWIVNFVRGDMGMSFTWNRPVNELVWERLGLTFVMSLTSLIFMWIVAFPVGIYAAVRQYSAGDYIFTFLSFIGLATPNFMLALILMYVGFKYL